MLKMPADESRAPEQLKEHYEVERLLADRLRKANKEERRHLYSALYDELFKRVPHHPQLTRKAEPKFRDVETVVQLKLLVHFLKPELIFLEVGSGDCKLALEVAKIVKKVYAMDVSEEITKNIDSPENFNLVISDGCRIPVAENSIDIAYSHQVMEHLHPDDALEQLRNIYQVLTPGGVYICLTPNRLSGPHDISKYFDEIATGFHLKEYTLIELVRTFKVIGFSKIRVAVRIRRFLVFLPPSMIKWLESLLDRFPTSIRAPIAHWSPIYLHSCPKTESENISLSS